MDVQSDGNLPASLGIHSAGADFAEDCGIYFPLVACRGMAGIAKDSFNLPDNIAKIGHTDGNTPGPAGAAPVSRITGQSGYKGLLTASFPGRDILPE